MVIGQSLKQIVTEYISATQIRFGLFLEQQNVTVDGFVLTGLSVVNDPDATITFSHTNTGFTGAGTNVGGGYDLTVSTASGAVTDSTGLIIVDVVLSSELAPSETIQLSINSLTLNGAPVNIVSANLPVITKNLLNSTIPEDGLYSFETSSYFLEVNSETDFIYSAKVVDDVNAEITWPNWLHIDPVSGLITGTPLNEHVGLINVVVEGTSAGAGVAVAKAYELTITNTNDAPTLTTAIADQSNDQYQAFSLDVSTHFDDVDVGDSGTYSISGEPVWLVLDASTGVLSGTPGVGEAVTTSGIELTYTDISTAFVSDTFDLSVVAVNAAATGAVTIAGTTSNGQVLTSSHTIADTDGIAMATYSHQWSRVDNQNVSTDIANATNATYTLTDDDVGYTLVDTLSFTDDAGFSESVSSAATAEVADIVKLIQVKNIQTLTAKQASIEINGVDYSNDSSDRVVKMDIYLTADGLASLNGSSTVVTGAEFLLNLDRTILDNVSSFGSSESPAYFMELVAFGVNEFNKETGTIAIAQSSAIVDTDVTNNSGQGSIAESTKIATIYLNPKPSVEEFELSLSNIIVDSDGVTIPLDSYAVSVSLGATAEVTVNSTQKLTNIDLVFSDESTGQSVTKEVVNGTLSYDQEIQFDSITIGDPTLYTSGVNVTDAVTILKHLVDLTDIGATGRAFNAADVNNDGTINVTDAVLVLKHIVDLEKINTFDLVDDEGLIVTALDPSMAAADQWLLVENGDVDGSGTFSQANLIDIV